jgi:hypothetical protein
MDARQAHAALSVRPVKTDQNDARGPPGRRVPMTAKVRVASTVQTAKGVEYIAASAPDTHHEATIDLGKNREPGWLRKSQKSLTQTAQLKNTPQSMKAASPSTGSATA